MTSSNIASRISSAKNPNRPKIPFDHAYIATVRIDGIKTGVGGKPSSPTKGVPYIVWDFTILDSTTTALGAGDEMSFVRYVNTEYNEQEAKAFFGAILGIRNIQAEAVDDLCKDDGAAAAGAVVRIAFTPGAPKKDGRVFFNPSFTHVQLPDGLRGEEG